VLEDIVNSVKASLYDRTSSPLFGSTLISWAAWNFRLLLVVVGDGKYNEKITYIAQVLYPRWYDVAIFWFVGPLLTAAVFIYLYPYPARKVYEHSANEQKKLRELRRQVEGDELLTVEEARDLRQKHLDMQIRFDTQIKALEGERDSLRNLVARLQDGQSKWNSELDSRVEAKMQELEEARTSQELPGDLVERRRSYLEAIRRAAALRGKAETTPEDLTDTRWAMTFNPDTGPSGIKSIHLLAGGMIGDGRNPNEYMWRLGEGGSLEFVQKDTKTHSRFKRHGTERWSSVDGPDLLRKQPVQFLMPESPSKAPSDHS
jgi:hypothetical protein